MFHHHFHQPFNVSNKVQLKHKVLTFLSCNDNAVGIGNNHIFSLSMLCRKAEKKTK